jgi:predicted metal-binding membrane protein
VAASAPTLRQVTLPASALLVVGAAAWVVVVAFAGGEAAMPGTMGLSLGAFAALWALMMTAMMLPTITPFVSLYTRTLTDRRARRILQLSAGYLAVWTAAALPSYTIALLAGQLVGTNGTAAKALSCSIFAACGIYQLTPLKDRCLARCRSPLGFVLKYGGLRGGVRDLRVGLSHGGYCLGCCWALMLVLVAVGLMNIAAMVVLATVVLAEKTWRHGHRLSRVVGWVALVLAVAVLFRPGIASGLNPPDMSAMP